jgi:aldose 1-epimerase
MVIKKRLFGYTPDGEEVYNFTLRNINGIAVDIINYGGIVRSLIVPDRYRNFEDIVLGFEGLEGYLERHPYFGAIVGRYANRIANARFELNGEIHHLAANDGNNHLHGGVNGLDRKVWEYEARTDREASTLNLTCFSPHGDEGYPGNLHLAVCYSLSDNNELEIIFKASTDRATPVNISHHGYFNLSAAGESVLSHELLINASRYTEVNDEFIPTGKLSAVERTPMDFRTMKPVGRDIEMVKGGYDHNYVLDESRGSMKSAAILNHPGNGRMMEVMTTQPGMQLYTGNFLDGTLTGKGGQTYHRHWGLCLETQHFPDSPNQPHFPVTILEPGEGYLHTTVFRFSVDGK